MIWSHLLLISILLPVVLAVLAALVSWRTGLWLAVVGAVLTLCASIGVLSMALTGGPIVYRVGGWAPPYGIVLVADHLSAVLAVAAAAVGVASTLQTAITRADVARQRFYQPMFLLMLAALNGAFFTGDLFNLYVFMEMTILSSFALVAVANRPISAEVTFKYAVLAALGSSLLLASIGLVYAGLGTLTVADIALRVRQASPPSFWPLAATLMLAAFLLKAAVFPFHFWQPDAHSAAPAPISAMLSGVLVKVGVYGLVRMVTLLFPDTPILLSLAPLGAVAALVGGLAAVANTDLKRLLAYSTISNIGLIVLALGWGGVLGLTAAIVHTINHALIKGSLFLAGGYIAERLDQHALRHLGGLAGLAPGTALAFGLGATSLAGLPPLSGFISKVALVQAGLAAQSPLLLMAAIAASALGIAYSARAFTTVFWGEPPPGLQEQWQASKGSGGAVAPILLMLVSLAFGLWPGPLLGLAAATAGQLVQPEIYITAVMGDGT